MLSHLRPPHTTNAPASQLTLQHAKQIQNPIQQTNKHAHATHKLEHTTQSP